MSTSTRRHLAAGIAGLAAVGAIALGASPASAATATPATAGFQHAQSGDPQGGDTCLELKQDPNGIVILVPCENPPAGSTAPVTPIPGL
ncbi:hypothetical protein GCM10010174_51800 [Kutzneria viridogrisea]|uniref:Secreted protein n=2 Tax=Kutzneria TaxID=43356 RepID=W5WC58_9PSEU|nr:hypothetical protein [Kutzneria albida]AHH98743.1 hypothetical protein KALB_5381 [Kutzneria albida DSM 43870]MBA8923743.1 hypothetical protein [Kutzneria viridogrisea]